MVFRTPWLLKFNPDEWHRWFALFPVNIGVGRLAWLSMVERRRIRTGEYDVGDYEICTYEHRLKNNGSPALAD